jgi:glutamate carboxypeptidase
MTSHLDLLRELVEIESPTYSAGVREVAELMAHELEALGATMEILDHCHLRAELAGNGAPLLLLGHTDTVWPVGTLEKLPFRIEDRRAFGPGIYDMKGCLVVLLEAIRAAGPRRRALRVFLTADEEMGSTTGREHIERAAEGTAAALVVEPPTASGHLKLARKGLGRFHVVVSGRAAHPGSDQGAGVSAIEELAHQVLALHALDDAKRGVLVNVGVVSGGTKGNVVADRAEAHVDVRIAHVADRDWVEQRLAALEPELEGTKVEVGGGWTRPPLEPSPDARQMFETARVHGRALGLDLHEASVAGGSDGNLVGALGVPVLDGLGAEGGGAHAPGEHVLLDSIPRRAQLLARLLEDPGI